LWLVALLGAGPVAVRGRTPGWRAKLPLPAGSRTKASTPAATLLRLPDCLFGLVVAGLGELLPSRREQASQRAVARRPSRPRLVEVLLCVVDLLDAQLADPLLDPVKPRARLLTRPTRCGAFLLLLPASLEHRPQQRQGAAGQVLGNELVQQPVDFCGPRAVGLDLVPAAVRD